MSRGDDGKTRVTFVWEPAARVPGERVRHSARRLVLTALAADGSVLFEGAVAPTGPAALDEPGTTPVRAVFDVAPGRLRLRMTIQDVAAQEIDRDVRELSIRDLRGGVAIGTPEVLRAHETPANSARSMSRPRCRWWRASSAERSVSDPVPPRMAHPTPLRTCQRSCSGGWDTRCGTDGIAGVAAGAATTRSICRSPVSPRAIHDRSDRGQRIG